MPFYDYRCPACGERFDMMRPLADRDAPVRCPSCGSGEATREFPKITIGGVHAGVHTSGSKGIPSCGGGG